MGLLLLTFKLKMFEDKAIPSRPFLPGYTSLRDRLGADLSLGENTIKMNTLGDVSSILITSPITLPLPNNNFTTLGVSSNSNFIIPNQTLNMTSSSEIMSQVTSSITPTSSLNLIDQQLNTLPTTEDPNLIPSSVVQEQEVSSSVIYSSNLLPAQDSEFINFYDDNIQEIAQDTGYIAIEYDVQLPSNGIVPTTGKSTQTYSKTRKPTSIILHIVDGAGTAQQTVDFVGSKPGMGIHYAVDRTGAVATGPSEDKITIHGNNWNQTGIGIEIVTYGGFKSSSNGSYKHFNYNTTKTTSDGIIDLGFYWFGARYTQEFTDVEINALEKLIRDIDKRNNGIMINAIKGKSLWQYIFGIPSKPKPGGKYQTTLIGTQIGQKTWTQPGIFGHTTGGGTHVDPYPTPKLIAMLKRLGFIE